jgi:Rhodopirellula transposase DDE domain
VGTDHDTAAFAVNTIANWWQQVGKPLHPNASRLLICADGGGSNGYRTRLWKTELAGLAESAGLTITACHLPPGTSKWNKIEHRLFSHISMNWRGRPLTSHEVIVNTIAATTTSSGLTVRAELDEAAYPTGVKIPDKTWKPSKPTASRLRDDRCEAGGPPRETGHRNGVFNGVDYRPHQGYSEGYDPQSGYRHPDDRGGPSTFRPRSHMSAARSERHDPVHRPAKPAPGDPRSRESP